jgi:hypothetical protein
LISFNFLFKDVIFFDWFLEDSIDFFLFIGGLVSLQCHNVMQEQFLHIISLIRYCVKEKLFISQKFFTFRFALFIFFLTIFFQNVLYHNICLFFIFSFKSF